MTGQVKNGNVKRDNRARKFLSRLMFEKPLGFVGAIITLILLLTGIFADFLAPYGMNEQNLMARLVPPSNEFLLGTDNMGRDILSRVIYGARITVIIGLSAATVSTVISAILGLLSGYLGGSFDLLSQRVVDAWMCLPIMIILMVIISMVGPGMVSLIIVMGIGYGFVGARVVRGSVISTKQNIYVKAAIVTGCSTGRILWRHILPNVTAPIIILFTTRVPFMILTEASLSFLGYGVPPPAPSWGGMLSGSGRSYMFLAPWMVIWPGLALAVVVFGVNMFGDALRDILDPRLIGGGGRFGVKQLIQKK
jgi:peptide/nickel transport system permease protein